MALTRVMLILLIPFLHKEYFYIHKRINITVQCILQIARGICKYLIILKIFAMKKYQRVQTIFRLIILKMIINYIENKEKKLLFYLFYLSSTSILTAS